MPDIDGYADLAEIKGRYYRYAGCPIPLVYTGNINTISDEIVSKAMLVVDNGNGTFPKSTLDTYLIMTIKYGDSTYLQKAVDSSGYEYIRIYSNSSWLPWKSLVSDINILSSRVDLLENTSYGTDIEQLQKAIYDPNGINYRLDADERSIGNHETRIKSLENSSTDIKISTDVSKCFTDIGGPGSIESCYFSRIGKMCNLTIKVIAGGLGYDYNPGDNFLTANPGEDIAPYKPASPVYGSGFLGKNSVLPLFNPNPDTGSGMIMIRHTGSSKIRNGSKFHVFMSWLSK